MEKLQRSAGCIWKKLCSPLTLPFVLLTAMLGLMFLSSPGWSSGEAKAPPTPAVKPEASATQPEKILQQSQTYYYDGTNYYQPCAQGSDMNYCVVSDPND